MAPGSLRDAMEGLLGGLVVGVVPARVVGLVDHPGDVRDLLAQRGFDPLLEGDVDHAAALAAAAETEVDEVLLDVEEVDPASVSGDRGVDHLVQDLLNLFLDVLVFHGRPASRSGIRNSHILADPDPTPRGGTRAALRPRN